MISFYVGENHYLISGEITRQFHNVGDKKIKYHAHKNGWFVSGTTANSEKECLNYLAQVEKWNEETLDKIKQEKF